MPLAVRMAKQAGVNIISFTKLNTRKETAHLEVSMDDFSRYRELAIKEAKKVNMTLDFGPFHKMPIKSCKRAFNSIYITCKGFVLPCCFINQGGRYDELTAKHNMGNAFRQDIREIWNSKPYRDFRSGLSNGAIPKVCMDCYIYE